MSDSITIARPYAEAAFCYAAENNKIDEWSTFLSALSVLVSNSHIVQTAEVQALDVTFAFINNVLQGFIDKNQGNFVKLLLENTRLKYVPDIYEVFCDIADKKQKKVKAVIVSSSPLNIVQRKKIEQKLAAKYNGTVEIECTVDPSLIGGLIIKVGDKVLDASVRKRLSTLSQSLQS